MWVVEARSTPPVPALFAGGGRAAGAGGGLQQKLAVQKLSLILGHLHSDGQEDQGFQQPFPRCSSH